jgi:Beta/Gamma crystallin
VILFEHSDFRGRTLTLRGTAPNLDSIDFNDRASSARALSGVWEMCTDADFRGTCRVYRPGEVRSVDPRLNDQFSSARLVGQ